MPKWLVYGEEPYLIDKFRKKIIDEVETPEFNLMETSEFTEAEQNFLCQHALFGDKKVLIYRANSLKESGEFVKYAKLRTPIFLSRKLTGGAKCTRCSKKKKSRFSKSCPGMFWRRRSCSL